MYHEAIRTNIIPFKQGDVFLRKNTVHSFENALLGGCHFSRVARIGLMSVARFSWVPNLYANGDSTGL